MLPTIIFYLALISTIGIFILSQSLDRYSKLSFAKQDWICFLYIVLVPCVLWSWLFWLLH